MSGTRWSRAVIELLALHEAFTKLGFDPTTELNIAMTPSGRIQFVITRKVNEKAEKFVIDIPDVVLPQAMQDEWLRAVAWWNNTQTPESSRQFVYDTSVLLADGGYESYVTSLRERGFDPKIPQPKKVKS